MVGPDEVAGMSDCDMPGCDGDREVVTPDGYVCDDCATDMMRQRMEELEGDE